MGDMMSQGVANPLDLMSGVLNPHFCAEAGFISNYDVDKIQGNSVDLRVKEVFRIDGGIVLHADGGRELPPYTRVGTFKSPRVSSGAEAEYFEFLPQHLYQVEFEETVNLTMNVCALTFLRSTMFKSGASGESGLFDSGYSGGTGMSMNVKFRSLVEKGSAIAQMVFFKAQASKSYDGFYTDETWRNTVS